ncbi:MAG: hypothetical protein IJY23_07480 [Clostridia bacterium]|nr:hypothetical protein [Clostridia bacterium]
MKKITSLLLALAILTGSMLALTSCGKPKNDGAEISVYLGERVYDFDPTDYYVDSNAEQVMSLLFDPLFTIKENGKLKCSAADDYDVDKKENTITIELRETYWSDRVRVKAEDYIYAWRNVLLDPNNANPAASLLYDIENAVEVKNGNKTVYELGAVASDTYEITITYRDGADYKQLLKNLASVATSPIRQDIATAITSGYWSKIVNTAVTNGPFMIKSVDEEENSFVLARNEGYHQKLDIKNPTKIVRPSQLVSFLTAGEGDKALTYSDIEDKTVFYMSDASLADRAENKKKAIVADDLSTYTYVFNVDNPLFAKKEVRQALSLAIDRNAIIDAITFGKAATGFLPDTVLDTRTGKSFNKKVDDLISASANVAKANELLSGVDFTGLDKNFTLTVNGDEESLAIANIVKTAWESLNAGFKVTVKTAGVISTQLNSESVKAPIKDSELQVLVNNAARGDRDFDVIAVDWQMYSTDPFVALSAFSDKFSGCGVELPAKTKFYASFGGYNDETYNALIQSAYDETDKKERSEILHEAEKYLVDSAAVIPLVFNQSFAFMHKDISKVDFDGLGNVVLTDMKQRKYEQYLD